MKAKISFACLLICIGIGIISYPWLKAWYFERQKDHAMAQWFTEAELSEESRENTVGSKAGEAVFPEEEESSQVEGLSYITKNMEGILTIEAIDLQTPILSEYGEYNLNLAICKLKGSSGLGDYGNYCLAGHRSRIYGRHFNRLKEVSVGDGITVETEQAVYHYLVTDAFGVTADSTWVLEDDFSKKQISLITCDYRLQSTGRFIVQGELEFYTEKDYIEKDYEERRGSL